MKRLQGKVALVIGAGSVGPGWGNGRATAVRFAKEGAKVFAVDLNEHSLRETVQRGGKGIKTFLGDATESKSVLAMVKACLQAFRRIDILVSRAARWN